MEKMVRKFVSVCDICNCYKQRSGRRYGKLLPKDCTNKTTSLDIVYIDTIHKWGLRDNIEKSYSFYAITMINPSTGFFEAGVLHTKTMKEVANVFDIQ